MPRNARRPLKGLLLFSLILQAPAAAGQAPKPADQQVAPPKQEPKPAAACDAERALSLIRQQVYDAKEFESAPRRVTLTVRAAAALWPSDETQARAAFADAFEVASRHYRELGDEVVRHPPTRPDSKLSGRTETLADQRLVVVRAVARHDLAWARELAKLSAEETQLKAEEGKAKIQRGSGAADKLLTTARGLLAEDTPLALSLARESLKYPAANYLSSFFNDLARADRAAADSFYYDALRTYANADPATLLLFSAYPFGLRRHIGLAPGYSLAGIPPDNFAPSHTLQGLFVEAFLQSSDRALKAAAGQPPPADEGPARPSEAEMIYTALLTLEALYGPHDKSFAARAEPLKQMASAMLGAQSLGRADNRARQRAPEPVAPTQGMAERALEYAKRMKDPDQHDRTIAQGLIGAVHLDPLEKLVEVANEIKDELLRRQFLDHIYFSKSAAALKDGRLEEASKLAARVESLEQRSLLMLEVAAAGLKLSDDKLRAQEFLESALKAAHHAPETLEKARVLLGVSHLYASFDAARGLEVAGEAVKTVNRLDDPELSSPVLLRRLEGRAFDFAAPYGAPGYSLENIFRELGRRDFEGALAAAGELGDKYLRGLAALTVAADCLEQTRKAEKDKKTKATPATKTPTGKKTGGKN